MEIPVVAAPDSFGLVLSSAAVSFPPSRCVEPALPPPPRSSPNPAAGSPPSHVDEAVHPSGGPPHPPQAEMAATAAPTPLRPHARPPGHVLVHSITRIHMSPSVDAIEPEEEEEKSGEQQPPLVEVADILGEEEGAGSPLLLPLLDEGEPGDDQPRGQMECASTQRAREEEHFRHMSQPQAQMYQPAAAMPLPPVQQYWPHHSTLRPARQPPMTTSMGGGSHEGSRQHYIAAPATAASSPLALHHQQQQQHVQYAAPPKPPVRHPLPLQPTRPTSFASHAQLPPSNGCAASPTPSPMPLVFHSASQVASAQALHNRVLHLQAQRLQLLSEYEMFVRVKAPQLSSAEAAFLEHHFRASYHELQSELNQTCATLDGTVHLLTTAEVPALPPPRLEQPRVAPTTPSNSAAEAAAAVSRLQRAHEERRHVQVREEKEQHSLPADAQRRLAAPMTRSRTEEGQKGKKRQRKEDRDPDEPTHPPSAYIVSFNTHTSLSPLPQPSTPLLSTADACACVVAGCGAVAVPRGPNDSLARSASL